MHISLFLFLIGLVIFLAPLQRLLLQLSLPSCPFSVSSATSFSTSNAPIAPPTSDVFHFVYCVVFGWLVRRLLTWGTYLIEGDNGDKRDIHGNHDNGDLVLLLDPQFSTLTPAHSRVRSLFNKDVRHLDRTTASPSLQKSEAHYIVFPEVACDVDIDILAELMALNSHQSIPSIAAQAAGALPALAFKQPTASKLKKRLRKYPSTLR